jgi:transposase-like protein
MSTISQPYFWDEQAAHAKLEDIVWPNGPVCPRCGATDRIGAVTGKGARAGLKFCCRCRKQFRATIGTMFEGSHVPLHKWFQACFLLSAAGSAISAHQLHLRLEVTNKTALGIVQRLAALISSVECSSLDGGLGLPCHAQTVGRSPHPSHRTLARAPSAIGWEELPWMEFPTQPRRQFLRFVETVRDLGCVDDDGKFDRLLTKIGTHRLNGTRTATDSSSGAAPALGFVRPPRGNPEHLTA